MRQAVGGAQKVVTLAKLVALSSPAAASLRVANHARADQYVENLLHGSLLDNIARALATHDYATVIEYVGNVHYFGRKNTSRASINADIVQDSRTCKSTTSL